MSGAGYRIFRYIAAWIKAQKDYVDYTVALHYLNDKSIGDSMSEIQFKPLSESYINLLHQWFQDPIIQKWYVRSQPCSIEAIKEQYMPRILGEVKVSCFIAYRDNSPLGLIQYYSVADHLPEGISKEPLHINNAIFKEFDPEKLVGIDCFIAEPKDRGKGIGVQMINSFIATLPKHIQAVLADPNIDNQQSIRCYEKVGFTRTQYSEDEKILILIKTLDKA